MAQSVKCQTLYLSLGLDLRVMSSSPVFGSTVYYKNKKAKLRGKIIGVPNDTVGILLEM